VVREGTYHRAAETLFISQSAVTQRIQALESALAQKLFVRSGRRVSLTAAGDTLVRYVRETEQREAALLAELGGRPGELAGRLTVAASTAEGTAWLAGLLAELARTHRNVDLALRLQDEFDPLPLLESGQIDAALTEVPVKRRGFRSIQVGVLEYVLVAAPSICRDWPAKPPWKQLGEIRAIDFSPADRVTLDHLALCLPGQDFSELRRYFANSTAAIRAWPVAGGG